MTERQWDVASIGWTRVGKMLDEGWEPFAVVQRQPLSATHGSQPTVYLRRPLAARSPSRTERGQL